nr:RHS repeat-associated core domain-containing protein [Burkholderia cenocepacia]
MWSNAVQEEWVARAPDRPTAVWGNVQAAAPALAHAQRPQNLRFQGQYLDRETGLHYNTFRFYDPDIGRFINPDPIGLMGGVNLYRYAPNPIAWIDPW